MVEHVGVTDELIGIRHYLHQHPERSFKEVETSAYLARLLRGHGIDVLDTTLETGVVALIEGEVPTAHRAARRHRRPADHRGHRPAVQLAEPRRDARLRP